jgi:hypothetical protein
MEQALGQPVQIANPVSKRSSEIAIEVVDNTKAPSRSDHSRTSGAKDLRLFCNGSLFKLWRRAIRMCAACDEPSNETTRRSSSCSASKGAKHHVHFSAESEKRSRSSWLCDKSAVIASVVKRRPKILQEIRLLRLVDTMFRFSCFRTTSMATLLMFYASLAVKAQRPELVEPIGHSFVVHSVAFSIDGK